MPYRSLQCLLFQSCNTALFLAFLKADYSQIRAPAVTLQVPRTLDKIERRCQQLPNSEYYGRECAVLISY